MVFQFVFLVLSVPSNAQSVYTKTEPDRVEGINLFNTEDITEVMVSRLIDEFLFYLFLILKIINNDNCTI